MEQQDIIISRDLSQSLEQALDGLAYDRLFVLTDETTHEKCWPLIAGLTAMKKATQIVIGATDEHKDLDTLADVRAYATHPDHVAAGKLLAEVRESRACVDYEI